MSDSVRPWTAAHQAPLPSTISQSLFKFMSIESVTLSNHLICCPPTTPVFLPSIFPNIRVFSSESALLIRWPKYWSFSISISPSSEYSGLISFRMDWFDLCTVQGTPKSLLQHHNLKETLNKIHSKIRFKCFNIDCADGCTTLNILNATELYFLNCEFE